MKIMRLIISLVLLIMVSACTTATTQTAYPTLDNLNDYSPNDANSNTNYNTDQNYLSNSNDNSWATGGTLHDSTIAEWRKASYSNRLATSADFVVYYFVNYLGLNDFSDMDKRKQAATDLEECISTAASDGEVDNEQVTHIAAVCLVSMLPPGSNSSPSSSNNSSPNTVDAKDFVKINDFDCSHDSIGNMIFEGKVKNTSSTYDLQFVVLRATVLSFSGEVINTRTGYIDSDILYANSSSTFKIYVDDPNYEGSQCRIKVERARFK